MKHIQRQQFSFKYSPQLALQKWEPDGRIGDFGNFLKVYEYWMSAICIVKYCFLSEVCRYDKNSASYYCFTSDVMYKWCKRLVYTHPDLLARFCKVNLSNAKKLGWLFFPGLINLRWSRTIMALKCDRRLLPVFGCTYEAISSM